MDYKGTLSSDCRTTKQDQYEKAQFISILSQKEYFYVLQNWGPDKETIWFHPKTCQCFLQQRALSWFQEWCISQPDEVLDEYPGFLAEPEPCATSSNMRKRVFKLPIKALNPKKKTKTQDEGSPDEDSVLK